MILSSSKSGALVFFLSAVAFSVRAERTWRKFHWLFRQRPLTPKAIAM